jgi:hypothetical protein
MGPSLLVSEPAGVVSGVFFGAVVFFIARACGLDHTWATVLACIFHFVANTLIAGHINLALVGGVATGLSKSLPVTQVAHHAGVANASARFFHGATRQWQAGRCEVIRASRRRWRGSGCGQPALAAAAVAAAPFVAAGGPLSSALPLSVAPSMASKSLRHPKADGRLIR